MVCIDDFAIRKGVKYATVMIDINSHKIIDMINSDLRTVIINIIQ